MNVPSYEFLGFAALVALLINAWSSATWRSLVWLAANLGFLATFSTDPRALLPFGALLTSGFIGMKFVTVRKERAVFAVLLLGLILAFCWLKRYAFLPQGSFLAFAYLTVGMSYVFFRILHLVIDAYQEALPERVGIVSYLNYTLNFTSLVSGPIQFYQDYRRNASISPPLTGNIVARAVARIISGLFKVSILSPLLFYAQERSVALLSASHDLHDRVIFGALVLIVFPIYVYVNFSGYMDAVIGTARFLRLELPENFDQPFLSKSFIDFWGRWHITLATWVKTYIYSPLLLALMRRFPSRRIEPWLGVLAYFVAFFFVGAWHGQTSMFLFLGVLLGLGISINKLYQIVMTQRIGRTRYRDLCANSVYAAFSRALTLSWFALCSLWFWSTWPQLAHFARLLGAAGLTLTLLAVFLAATILPLAWKAIEDLAARVAAMPMAAIHLQTAWYTALLVIVLSATVILNAPAPHIVYKAF